MIGRRAPGRPGEARVTGAAARQVVISSFDNPAQPFYNGGGVAVVEMIAARLRPHFEVTVVTAGRGAGAVVRDGIRYRVLPVAWAGPRTGQLLYHLLLPIAAWRVPHDLWIENFTPPFSTSFLPLFSRAKVLGFAQALTGDEMARKYHLPFFLVERLGLRFYDDIVVLNPADQERVRQHSPSAAVRLIPNGIEQRGLDELTLGAGEHILFLGRIDIWRKGLDLLIEAYEQSGLALPLLIAGAGVPREERRLAELIAATRGNVRWVGHVTGAAKQELLERSAFVTVPSRAETFGLAALEAMSRGKAVLHFDLPTLRWMGGDIRVPAFDTGALAAQMRGLADDQTARSELGRAAHAAAQQFGITETADRYLSVVRDLIGPPGTPGPARGRPARPARCPRARAPR
jgi:glycosyltransferase involved in cell wall biosynthesis